jgi:Flp pilus assembly protein TadG
MVEFYVDNVTGKMQAYQYRVGVIDSAATDRNSVTIGLDDIAAASSAELQDSTISVWLIDHIRFKFSATLTDPGTTNGYGHIQTSILPRGLPSAASAYTNVSDIQELAGWPLTKGEQYYTANTHNPGASGSTSWSYTYRPKSKLALNRIQEVVMAFMTSQGVFTYLGSVHVQAQRGT